MFFPTILNKDKLPSFFLRGYIMLYMWKKFSIWEKVFQLISFWQLQLFTISLTYHVKFICNLITN